MNNNIKIGLDISPMCKNRKYTEEELHRFFPEIFFKLDKEDIIYKQLEKTIDEAIKK